MPEKDDPEGYFIWYYVIGGIEIVLIVLVGLFLYNRKKRVKKENEVTAGMI
jgi:LPXTG-motif cell wall-anchored protein